MKLLKIQPSGGGFLEAIPLTSFVAMTLTPLYGADHPVAAKCLDFIERSVRPDGSWAIDSNLSVWLTTNAVKALAGAGSLGEIDSERTRRWIADQQYGGIHPYTNSPPGAWAWTHLDGGVPDTDDTSSAMLAGPRRARRHTRRRALAARHSEQRRRLAYVLPRMGQAAVRQKFS